MVMRFCLVWICMIFATGDALSMDLNRASSEEAMEALEIAVATHDRQLRSLIISRGVSPQHRFNDYESSLRAIHNRLRGNDESLILYHHDGKYLQVFAVTGDMFAYGSSKISHESLSSQVNDLRTSLGLNKLTSTRAPRKRGVEPMQIQPVAISFEESVAELSGSLFPPDVVVALKKTKHLIIVPTGSIGTVPFALLRPQGLQGALLEVMDVRIAPGLFDLDSARYGDQDKVNLLRKSVVVGNPEFAKDPVWNLPPLPGAESEARFVARAFDTKAITGKKASLKKINNSLNDSSVIYLATHGVADADDPLDGSFIALAPDAENKTGRWTARAIQSRRMQASLVVLSACQTGLGKVHDGGVIGLARAFQIAGARQVAMSLWSVSDEATEEMMKVFIMRLKEGDAPHIALRSAMLAEKEKRPDPVMWAPFVIFGL